MRISQPKINIFGSPIHGSGLVIDEDEVIAINNLETPSSKPQVHRLLGSCQVSLLFE